MQKHFFLFYNYHTRLNIFVTPSNKPCIIYTGDSFAVFGTEDIVENFSKFLVGLIEDLNKHLRNTHNNGYNIECQNHD